MLHYFKNELIFIITARSFSHIKETRSNIEVQTTRDWMFAPNVSVKMFHCCESYCIRETFAQMLLLLLTKKKHTLALLSDKDELIQAISLSDYLTRFQLDCIA